jgi:hypothetical protein
VNKAIIILFLLISNLLVGQNFEWATSINDDSLEYAGSLVVDSNGNIISIGYFRDTVDFDPGIGILNIGAIGEWDLFIQKLDSNGNLVWIKTIGGPTAYTYTEGKSISIDNTGNLYIAGMFTSTVDFDPGSSVFYLTSAGFFSLEDVFVLKLNSSGDMIWVKSFEGAKVDFAFSLALDDYGAILVTGMFQDTVDFDPGPLQFRINAILNTDIFVTKLDTNGSFIWAKSMGGSGYEMGKSVGTDAIGNVYVSGFFGANVDFDPGPGVTNTAAVCCNDDAFVVKLDSAGNYNWVRTMGGAPDDESFDLVVDSSGNVYSTGWFRDTADFDPGPGIMNLVSNGSKDIFIQKLAPNGDLKWAKSIGGQFDDWGRSITLDDEGFCYITGFSYPSIDFDPGPGVYSNTPTGTYESFILKLDTNGNLYAAKTTEGGSYCDGYNIHVDSKNNIYVTGMFIGTVDFDPGPGTYNMTSIGVNNGVKDIFIMKLSQCMFTDSLISDSACISYNSPSGNYVWNSSGVYSDIMVGANQFGCDSIILVNLNITMVDTSVTNNSPILISNMNNVSYQWMDCGLMQIIPGETNQNFSATSNGSYSVIINNNGCIDTSDCYSITGIGLNENSLTYNIVISPNPTSSQITIEGLNYLYSLTIYNSFGQLLYTESNIIEPNKRIDLSSYNNGLLFIRVESEGEVYNSKILKTSD